MSIKPGKRDVAKVARLLEQPHETAEDAALAALELAWQIYEKRAKFTVVGQLIWDHGPVPADRADAVCLGGYATETQARDAGRQLAFSTLTNEQFKWWMLQIHHGSPHEFYKKRKALRREAEVKPLPEWTNVSAGCDYPSEEVGEDVA